MNLSPRGEEQALALAGYLRDKEFDAVYASPMRRVQQTLEPLRKNGVPSAKVLQALREVDFGVWTGLSWEQVQAKFKVSPYQWLDQLECGGIPEAECGPDFRARVEPSLRQIIEAHPGQQVAVACHGGVIRMMLSILLDLPLPRMGMIEIDYASITQISCKPGRIRLELLNFTPWRDLPLNYGVNALQR
jgi:broad specificity phosphatase PhoE